MDDTTDLQEIARKALEEARAEIPILNQGQMPDDIKLWPEFVIADLNHALELLTDKMRELRKKPGWKSKDLQDLKDWRKRLLPWRDQFVKTNDITQEEADAVNAALVEFTKVAVAT